MGQRQVTAGFPPRPPGVPGHSWLPAQGPQEPRLPFTLARGCHPWQQAEGGQGLQGGSCGTQGRKRPWGGMGATLAWPRGRGMSPRGWDGQGSYHDTQALMGRTQTWGRLDVSGACLAQKSSIFIQACSVAPISRRGHTSSSPAKGRRACRHPHSSGLEQRLWVPEAPGVPALLS